MHRISTFLSVMAFAVAVCLVGCTTAVVDASGSSTDPIIGGSGGTTNSCTKLTLWVDSDKDGFGSSKLPSVQSCDPLTGYANNNTDCDDSNINVHPGVKESCDKVDNDCNGQTDETTKSWHLDYDGDGYGSPNPKFELQGSCTGIGDQKSYVANADDCNDNDLNIHPGAKEICDGVDANCDSNTDKDLEAVFYADLDFDLHGVSAMPIKACKPTKGVAILGDDCNDNDAKVYPAAPESCNNVDDDCDGLTDNKLVFVDYYVDGDKDGFGAGNPTNACLKPAGSVTNNTDCNDADATINAVKHYFVDTDKDSYGSTTPADLCEAVTPTGYANNSTDCNDDNKTIHPGAAEVCDLVDQNCNGVTDEDVQTVFHWDADHDGYGDPKSKITLACTAPAGMAFGNGDFADCDDNDPNVHPGAPEICDGKDNGCVGLPMPPKEPDSLCEDGDKFTQDWCLGASGCSHKQETLTLSCFNPSTYSVTDGYACSVAYYFGEPAGLGQYTVTVGKDSVTLLMKDVCSVLKTGSTLRVNSAVFLNWDLKTAIWVGGQFTKLIDNLTNAAISGSPGDVTLFDLDTNYVLTDFAICQ